MTSPAVENFLANLEKSNLLAADALQKVRADAEGSGANSGLVEFALKLVEQELLTPWQVEALVAGRTSFFLGKYKLLGELGRGGMGAVYKAVQTRLGRVVALKVMATKLVSDEQAVSRFRREIEAVAALDHPNVVAAFDADQTEGTHFLVMEYVEGESLAALLKREHRLPIATACDYIRQAALGLAHAHERGMAHRDIKPANLLLTRTSDGQPLVKILDMGLARFTVERGEETELTSTGQVMGTPDYIAPEQARSTKRADIRSDIYSLGCTLFRCLTGHLPFDGESVMEKLMARAMGDAPPLRQRLPEAPAALEAVVAKMLARDPAARYQTPADVAAALEPFSTMNLARASLARTAVPAAARDPGVDRLLHQLARETDVDESGETDTGGGTQLPMAAGPRRTGGKLFASVEERRRADRRRIRQSLFGTLLLGVAGTAAWWWWAAGQTHLEFDWPAEERAGAHVEVDGYQLALPERAEIRVPPGRAGRRRLHIVRPGYETIDTTLEFARGQKQTYRPEWTPTAETVRLQQLAGLDSEIDSLLKQFAGHLPPADNSALQSLRQRFTELRPAFRSTSDQPRFDTLWRRLPFPADYLNLDPSLDRNLALEPLVMSPPPMELVAAWGDARLKVPAPRSLSVSPIGRLAATWSNNNTVYVWDLDNGKLYAPPIAPFECQGPAYFSPDGKFLAFLTDAIVIWSVEERRAVKTIPLPGTANAYTWVPGSSLMAWTNENHAIHLSNFETGEMLEDLPFPSDNPQHILSLAASRDGRFLAALGAAGKLRVFELATRQWSDLPMVGVTPYVLAFSPDGGQLAAGIDNLIYVWDLATHELRFKTEPGDNWGIGVLSWRPDGKLLCSNTGTAEVLLRNTENGELQTRLSTRGYAHTQAAFSQDGRRLVTACSDGPLQVWDADSYQEVLPTGPFVVSAAIDPLGEWIALGTSDRTIELRDLASGAIRETIALRFVPSRLKVSPDRKLIGVVAAPPDFRMYAIPLDGRQQVLELRELGAALDVAFSRDSALLLALDQGGHNISGWNLADSKLTFKAALDNPKVPALGLQMAVSGDGRTLFVVGGTNHFGSIAAFSLPDGKNLYFAAAPPMPYCIAMAGTPERAITSSGPYVHLVDPAQGKTRETVPVPGASGPRVYVTGLNGSPDGDHIVAGLSDGKLWFLSAENLNAEGDVDVGSRLMAPMQALYTPDGRHVVTVNANGTVCVWRIQDWAGKAGPSE